MENHQCHVQRYQAGIVKRIRRAAAQRAACREKPLR